MHNIGLETSLWKVIATAEHVDAVMAGMTMVLRRLPAFRSVDVRLSWVGYGQGFDARTVMAWLGGRPHRFALSSESPAPSKRGGQTGATGLQALRLEVPGMQSPVMLLESIDAPVPDDLLQVVRDTATAALIAEARRPNADEALERSTGAVVRLVASDELFVGAASGLASVMQRVEMVAPQDVPVLLLGETGSGKEVIARAVHVRSRRAAGPFVRVNCGAIPRELIDSELFGHEKGSFTGAVDRRRGWFERAHTGTLLLDEIGELPPDAQVRLLRILQDGTFNRVGGSESVTVQVRIIAATHRDLPAMVDQRAFREDLWYRIATFPIHIPPLRERPQDIAELARHFARKASVRFGLPGPRLEESGLRLLQAYPWPGNIRELAAVIDRAMILGEGRHLDVAGALGLGMRSGAETERTDTPATRTPGAPVPSVPRTPTTLEDAMKRHIEAALERSLGRVEGPFGAAAMLGINPHTLRSRMRKLGVDWKRFRSGGR